jgi:hypothetical protein
MMDGGDMSERQGFEQKMRAELAQLKVEYENLKARAGRVESELELHKAEQKLELFAETHEDQWEEFKLDLERSWESLRNLIKAVIGP